MSVVRHLLPISCALLAVAAGCGGSDRCGVEPGLVCSVAGTGDFGFNDDGLLATDTDLFLLSAVRRGPLGQVHLMDFNNQRVRVIDDDGRVETVIGSGEHALADTSVPAGESPLENPIDFAWLAGGTLVFTSYHDPRVLALGPDGYLQAVAGDGEVGVVGDEGDGGDALAARFIQLDGIAVAPDGAIYVSDSLANRVRVIRDGVVETVAGTGTAGYSGDGGPATEADLHWPTALAFDAAGDLLIADTFNHVIRRLDAAGTLSTVIGSGQEGFSGDGGPALAAQLAEPYGLAVAGDGTIYVSDRSNFRIRVVSPEGDIDTLAGTGEEGRTDGPALESSFGYLARISLHEDELLIADQSNCQARRLTLP